MLSSRRDWLLGVSSLGVSAAVLRGAALSSIDRVNKVLRGEDVDRSPFTLWHHFLDTTKPGSAHAQSTLAFHDKFKTDLVKVMSDYAYPKAKGAWSDLKVDPNPFPQQIQALELIKKGLTGKAFFVETIFNSYNQAEKLSSPKEVLALKNEKPQKLLDALDVITKSQINHAKKAIAAGASGILLAIANAQPSVMSEADYSKFSEPFDKAILAAVRTAPLNVLHLHADSKFGDKIYMDHFHHGWAASAVNFTLYAGMSVADWRKRYPGLIMAGLDERKFRKLTPDDIRSQYRDAHKAAGTRFLLSPGCSVPNDSTDEELLRVAKVLGAA